MNGETKTKVELFPVALIKMKLKHKCNTTLQNLQWKFKSAENC